MYLSTLFLALFFNIAAFVLGIFALLGSTYNSEPLNKIYAAQLNLKNMSLEKVFPTVASQLSSSSSLTLSSFGLPSYINFGLWSYCTGNTTNTVYYCSKPNGIQNLNFNQILEDQITNTEVLSLIDSLADILLPSSFSNDINTFNKLAKAMFLCLIIAVVLLAIQMIITIVKIIFCWFPSTFKIFTLWILRVIAFLSFIGVAISAAISTAVYSVAKKQINNNSSDYGLELSMRPAFYGIIWGAVVASFINLLLVCLFCRLRDNKYYQSQQEIQPIFIPTGQQAGPYQTKQHDLPKFERTNSYYK
ncbi:hypothetical protein ACO0RG_002069 [Hanseniaspora osmophila]|uniref:Protein PUN1 n=1 Tax=Hanseniaspora osmophila TaxID=56408 RepID=A0A1E5RHL7_9ASCO|nr:Protein PUN1 [Hanseniaspora osmophila]